MRILFLSMLMLLVIASPAAVVLADQEPSNDSVSTAAIQTTSSAAVTPKGGLFSLTIGDIDFVGIGGLLAGDVVTLLTTPLDDPPDFEDPDTIVGLFNSAGTELCEGDDAANNNLAIPPALGLGSLCRFEISTAGDYFAGVTGFSPAPFDGAHFEEGKYSLTVNVTRLPEPGVLLQLASGALGLAVLHARRRANG